MRANNLFFLFLIGLFVQFGCSENPQKEHLDEIELMLKQQKNNEACKLLDKMAPETLTDDEECTALFWLLKMQADVRLGHPIPSVEPLRQSVRFYEKKNDKKRLPWVYYYMGYVLDDLGEKPEAIVFLKKGESVASEDIENNIDILHHIYQCLTFMNINAKVYDLSKHYGLLALKYSHAIGNSGDKATDLLNLSVVYNSIGKSDSAYYYTKRIIPLLDSVPDVKRAFYLGNIGIEFIGIDNDIAKKYLLKSIEKNSEPYFCKALAQIYLKEGDKIRAEEMWKKALLTNDLNLKVKVVKDMAKASADENNYKKSQELNLLLVKLNDSLYKQQDAENIKGHQELYEKDYFNGKLLKERNFIGWIVVVLFVAVIILIIWLFFKRRANKNDVQRLNEKLAKIDVTLEEKNNEIGQLQQVREEQIKNIEQLNRNVGVVEEKYQHILTEGKLLYEQVINGGNTLEWNKEDFLRFVQYYKLINANLVFRLENDYENLSPRQMAFVILYDMGFDDEGVMRALVLTESSIRSSKTRINAKCVVPPRIEIGTTR
jgi:hypothetical protein